VISATAAINSVLASSPHAGENIDFSEHAAVERPTQFCFVSRRNVVEIERRVRRDGLLVLGRSVDGADEAGRRGGRFVGGDACDGGSAAAATTRRRGGGSVDPAAAAAGSLSVVGRSPAGGRDGVGRRRRPRPPAAAPQGEQPRAATHARPQLGAGRAARGDAVRSRPVRAQAVQDRHAPARQELHPHAEPVPRRDAPAASARVRPATRRRPRRRRAARRRRAVGRTTVVDARPEGLGRAPARPRSDDSGHRGLPDAARRAAGGGGDRGPPARSSVASALARLPLCALSPGRPSQRLRRVASSVGRSLAASATATAVRPSLVGRTSFNDVF